MTVKRFKGSCICKKVQFEVGVDLSKGTFKCNCPNCIKTRLWGAIADANDLKILSGEDILSKYTSEMGNIHHFCPDCGIRLFARNHSRENMAVICISALDGLDPKELVEAPIMYVDGANDNFSSAPSYTAHL